MKEIVFLLEEESAKVLIESLFSRIVERPEQVIPRFLVFEGKQDLEKQLPKRIAGYLNPQAFFIVMRDQDQGDCRKIKQALLKLCPASHRDRIKIRIACHELESFYLADLNAVEVAFRIGKLAARQRQAKFRDPDKLASPSGELKKLTGERYQKVAGSRTIAPHMNLETNRSNSFMHLIRAIRDAAVTDPE